MSNHDVMLLGQYKTDPTDAEKAEHQPRIQQAITDAQKEIASLNLDVNTPEGIERANNCIKTSVDALNIPGFSVRVVPASEGALEALTDLPPEVREGIKQAMAFVAEAKANGGHAMSGEIPEGMAALFGAGNQNAVRMQAVKSLSAVLAHYAVARGTSNENGGAPSMFHDIGALLGTALLSIGQGVNANVGKMENTSAADPFVKSVVSLCNRIAVMSFVGFLTSESEENDHLSIDRDAMIADIRAVLDGKTAERFKEIGDTLEMYGDATKQKQANKLN